MSITLAVATPIYADPALGHGQPHTLASDIYSLGVTYCEIMSGKLAEDLTALNFAALIKDPAAAQLFRLVCVFLQILCLINRVLLCL
jgi:serine/threonine protein kinase